MDKSIVNRKQPSKAIGLTRSAINKDFVVAPNVVKGFRHSSIEPSNSNRSSSSTSTSSTGNNNIFSSRNAIEIRKRYPDHDFYRHGNNLVNYSEHNRQTVCIENPSKLYQKGYGLSNDILSSANQANSKYSAYDKAKWTHKRQINDNFSV